MFSVKFNKYLKEYKCSAKKFSDLTEISEPTISRYRTGKTVPSIESGNIELISKALAELSQKDRTEEEIYKELLVAAYEDLEMVDYRSYSEKLALLIERLDINQSRMAEAIHISPSYLSRICSGGVKPRNPVYIAESVAHYVTYNYSKAEERSVVQYVIWGDQAEKNGFNSDQDYYRSVRKWLLNGESDKSRVVDNLFYKYGEYDKNTYLHYQKMEMDFAINEEMKKKDIQTFMGSEGLKKAFYLWLQMACDSKLNDEIIIFDEVIAALGKKDINVALEYAYVMEELVKTGKQLTVLHNLEESTFIAAAKVLLWMPLNMSGRITHFCMDESKDKLYRNALLIASNCALIANLIEDDFEHGYYTLVTSSAEVMIAKARAEMIRKRMRPTYTYHTERVYVMDGLELCCEKIEPGDRIEIYMPMPPAFVMNEAMLRQVLQRASIPEAQIEGIVAQTQGERIRLHKITEEHQLFVHLDYMPRNKWEKDTINMVIGYENINLIVTLTYDEYQQLYHDAREFADHNEHINLEIEYMDFYKNMLLMYVPEKMTLAATPGYSNMNLVNYEKRVVDGLEELLFVLSKKNRAQVFEDPEKKALYLFYKKLIES